jgi:hypothetical protein
MGGNGVQNAQEQIIVCEFHGVTVDADVKLLGAEILALVRRRAAGGVVKEAVGGRLEIEADFDDHHAIEALRLEIRRLARRYGGDLRRLTIAAGSRAAGVDRT